MKSECVRGETGITDQLSTFAVASVLLLEQPEERIIILDHLRMQPEGYGAAIYIFEPWARIAFSSLRFLFPAGL